MDWRNLTADLYDEFHEKHAANKARGGTVGV